MLVDGGNNLGHLCYLGLFGVLDLFDPFITLLGQIGQIVLKAHHAVVGGGIRALLDAVLFCNTLRLRLALSESVAEIVSGIAPLFGEGASLGMTQQVGKLREPSLDLSAVGLALRKCH